MAWSFVQGNGATSSTVAYPGNVSAATVTLNNVTAGQALVLLVGVNTDGTSWDVTDNNGNTWLPANSVRHNYAAVSNNTEIYLLPSANAGNTTVTVTRTGGTSSYWNLYLAEYSYTGSNPVVRAFAKATTASGTSHASGSTQHAALSGDLVIGAFFDSTNNLAPAPTDSKTARAAQNGTASMSGAMSELLSSAAATQSATFSSSAADTIAVVCAIISTQGSYVPSYIGEGAWGTGSATTVTPALPTGLAANDQMVAFVHHKTTAATISTPAGWTVVTSASSANGAGYAANTGDTKTIVYTRTFVAGDTAPTFNLTGGTTGNTGNNLSAQILAFRMPGSTLDVTATVMAQSTSATSWSANDTALGALVAGDVLCGSAATMDDAPNTSAFNATQTGMTIGTRTALTKGTSTTGSDMGYTSWHAVSVTGTSSSSTTTLTATASATAYGTHALVRLRPVAGFITHQGAAALTATSTFAAAAVRSAEGLSAFTATSVLTTAATSENFGTVTLSATSTLSATASIVRDGAASFTSSSTMSAGGTRDAAAAASLAATSTLASAGIVTNVGTASLSAASTLVSAGTATNLGIASLTATSTLVSAGTVTSAAAAALTATSTLASAGTVTNVAAAAFTATSTLTSAGSIESDVTASLTATSTFSAGAYIHYAGNLYGIATSNFEDGSLGGFFDSVTGQTQTNDSTQAYAGTKSLKVDPLINGTQATATITTTDQPTVTSGTNYTLSGYVKVTGGSRLLELDMFNNAVGVSGNGPHVGSGQTIPAGSWTAFTTTFTATSTGALQVYWNMNRSTGVNTSGDYWNLDQIDLRVAAAVTQQGAAALTASSTLSSAGTVTKLAASAFSATSTLSSGADRAATIGADLSATSTLAAAGLVTSVATVSLTATSTLATAASQTHASACALVATSTFVAAGTTGNEQLGAAAFSATSTLATPALQSHAATGTLTATSTLAAAGTGVNLAAVTLSATSALAASAGSTQAGVAALASSSVFVANVGQLLAASVAMVASSTFSATVTNLFTTHTEGLEDGVVAPYYDDITGQTQSIDTTLFYSGANSLKVNVLINGTAANSTLSTTDRPTVTSGTRYRFKGRIRVTGGARKLWIDMFNNSVAVFGDGPMAGTPQTIEPGSWVEFVTEFTATSTGPFMFYMNMDRVTGVSATGDYWNLDNVFLTFDASVTVTAGAVMSASSSLNVGELVTAVGSASLAATSTLVAASLAERFAFTGFTATSTLVAAALPERKVILDLSATSILSVNIAQMLQAGLNFEAVSTLSVLAKYTSQATAGLSASSTLDIFSTTENYAAVALTANSVLNINAALQLEALLGMLTTSTFTVGTSQVHLGSVAMVATSVLFSLITGAVFVISPITGLLVKATVKARQVGTSSFVVAVVRVRHNASSPWITIA